MLLVFVHVFLLFLFLKALESLLNFQVPKHLQLFPLVLSSLDTFWSILVFRSAVLKLKHFLLEVLHLLGVDEVDVVSHPFELRVHRDTVHELAPPVLTRVNRAPLGLGRSLLEIHLVVKPEIRPHVPQGVGVQLIPEYIVSV